MKRRAFLIRLILAATALPVVSLLALAQDGHDLSWWTVDGGGTTFCTGGGYSLGGTVGQADAGLLSGGGYTLSGGFWRGGAVAGNLYEVYLPLVVRHSP